MEYINVKDGIIIDHLCGAEKPEGAIEVPSGFPGFIGAKLASLKDDFSGIKPISQQVSEGILTIPEGMKASADDTGLVRMEQDEIDAAFPPEVWAIPGDFYSISVHKMFDRDGKFGYFPPDGAIKMKCEQPTAYYRAEPDGTWAADTGRAKDTKLLEINAAYDVATSSLVSSYPATELLTFDKQEKEARAYTADPSTSTPFLSGLAKARGITLDDLVGRVIAKSEAFASAVATLTGQRQRYEDMLGVATTAEEIEAIVPEYKLPEA